MTFAERVRAPASAYCVLAGRAHYRHALRLPLDEHVGTFSPPRGGKTGWLGRVILHYPGPVLSTTTKHDVYSLTAAVVEAGEGARDLVSHRHHPGHLRGTDHCPGDGQRLCRHKVRAPRWLHQDNARSPLG